MKLHEKLDSLSSQATPGEWRVGADLIRIHPYTPNSKEGFHRNGYAKTIALVGKEDGDWRNITQQVSDTQFIVCLVNAYRKGELVVAPAASDGWGNGSGPD